MEVLLGVELWIITGFIAVLFKTVYQSWQKKLNEDYSSVELTKTAVLIVLISTLTTSTVLVVLLDYPLPDMRGGMYAVMAGLFLYTGLWLFNLSMKYCDLSVSSPLQQTIPVFVAFIEPLVLASQGYSLRVVLSAVLVVIGAYFITIKDDFRTPIRNITGKGPLLAIISAILFAFASITTHHTTQFMPVLWYIVVQSATGLIVLTAYSRNMNFNTELEVLGYGSSYTLTVILDITTLSLVAASIATVFFRLSLVFNIAIGLVIYKERNPRLKIVGASLILLSIVSVSLFAQ